MTINKNNIALTSPGERLKYIRSLLRLSRSYIQEKYGLPEVTLKSWENSTANLTTLGIKRCMEVYRSEGMIISEDWIKEGVGLDPKQTITVSQYFSSPQDTNSLSEGDDEFCMLREAHFFKDNDPKAVIMIVSNDDMRPFYFPGDYIGGKMRYGQQIETAVNKNCIIQLKNGSIMFRRLVKNFSGGYNLVCLNPNETTSEPVIYDADIDSVAPVIWQRTKN
jgi:transcriptional regulator with XRE-family HTH domain